MVLALTACGSNSPPPAQHPDWVIHSQIRFLSSDLRTPGEPLRLDSFRLSFSYIAGDLYGSPTTGDLAQPVIHPDLRFDLDLNSSHADLLRSLEPTDLSLGYLKIEPADARIARLAPQALQREGIEQIATVDWVDMRSSERLMLIYFDRPARITGALSRNGHTVRYNIRANAPGYFWVGQHDTDTGARVYTEVDKPDELVLAITPREAVTAAPAAATGKGS